MRTDPEKFSYTLNRWDVKIVEFLGKERHRIAEELEYDNKRDFRPQAVDKDVIGVAGEYALGQIMDLAYPTDLTPSPANFARGDLRLPTGEWIDVKTQTDFYQTYYMKVIYEPNKPTPVSQIYALVTMFGNWDATLIGFAHRDNVRQEKYIRDDPAFQHPCFFFPESEMSATIAEALAWQMQNSDTE